MAAPGAGIVLPGRNCWHVERADRFRCVQDGADHFRWVRKALLGARRSIFILGWDLQTIDLVPQDAALAARSSTLPGAVGGPTRLDLILAHVARRRPDLRAYVLIWDFDALYTLERDPFLRWRLGWRMPRHVHFGFDDRVPFGGSHHQKVIVVDDSIAFCGSLDLTTHRFDTCRHPCEEPLRTTPGGHPYGPYHEISAMVSGPVAARLGELARERWRDSQGDDGKLPPLARPEAHLWPPDAEPDFTGADVAIARTLPEYESRAAVRECETLLLDAIGAARRSIYIESQYFTSEVIGNALAARLREPDGPEVLVVVPRECHGWLERNTMGAFRDAVFRRMAAADAHGRLRLLHPMASVAQDIPTFVHSKVLIADDVLLRIGSANFARRSMGMDSECDLAADGSRDPRVRGGIRRVRDRLLGEHLGLNAAEVAEGSSRAGSLRRLVDARAGEDRTLVRIDPARLQEELPSEAVRAAADPDGPVEIDAVLEAAVPSVGGSRLAGAGVTSLAFLSLFPVELLATAAGVLLGAVRGIPVALAGALLLATIGYAAGRLLDERGLRRWMNRRAYRSARQLGAQGVRGVMSLRLAARGGDVPLFCGARRVPFGSYLLGSALFLAPLVVALAGLGGLLRQAALHSSPGRGVLALATVLLLLVVSATLRSIVLSRRYAPSLERHRSRAEFG